MYRVLFKRGADYLINEKAFVLRLARQKLARYYSLLERLLMAAEFGVSFPVFVMFEPETERFWVSAAHTRLEIERPRDDGFEPFTNYRPAGEVMEVEIEGVTVHVIIEGRVTGDPVPEANILYRIFIYPHVFTWYHNGLIYWFYPAMHVLRYAEEIIASMIH